MTRANCKAFAHACGMYILLLAVVVTPILIMILPMRASWAWMNLYFLVSLLLWLDLHLVPQQDKELAWATAVLCLGILNGLAIIAFVIRLSFRWVTGQHWWTDQKLSVPEMVLHAVGGIFLGLAIFLLMSTAFDGTGHAGLAHISVICLVLVIVAFGQSNKLLALYSWSLSTALVTSTLASAIYPAVINFSASQHANGAPYCIYLNQSRRLAVGARDLTFLTFGKGTNTAHATLIVTGKDGPVYGNWSYRESKFMVPWDIWTSPPGHQCTH